MNASVTQFLLEKFGIQVSAGKKTGCPYCGHNTLSINKNDNLAKCFHPDCEKFIRPFSNDNDFYSKVYGVLEKLYQDFHNELLKQQNQTDQTAYSYLSRERNIHPKTITEAMLGVVPQEYNSSSIFSDIEDELSEKLQNEKQNRAGKRGRPLKQNGLNEEKQIDLIQTIKEKLLNCLEGTAGWLCFFYTDENHRITAIRFRKPYSKEILFFKPFQKVGVFGLNLFNLFESPELTSYNQNFIVVEGEFNLLSLQSLSIKYCDSQGWNPGYIHAAAVGSVTCADCRTLRKVCKTPIICYDNDISGAGLKLVEKTRRTMYVSAFTTPDFDSDLDDFIQRNRNEKTEDLWSDVKHLISQQKFFPRNVDELINDIKNIRCKNGQNKNLREFEMNQKIAEIVIDDLNMRGEFYRNESEVFFFDKVRKHLCKISSGDLECKLLLDNLGLNRSERLFNYISEAIHAFGYKNGKVTKIHTTSFYDSTNNISYLYNHDSQIYRITPNSVDLVDNGTDGILFIHKQKTDPFKFLEFDNNQTFSWLDRDFISDINFDTSSNSTEDVQLLLKVWLYALFFESIMPTKPILTFIGPKGSGKSFVQRLIGIILFGRYFNVTPVEHNQKDFDAAVSNSYYMVLDNVENSPSWLQDRLAVLSTGGTLRKRLYYTTNEEIDISLRCFLAINAIEPKFRRDDIADRLLIMPLNRIEKFIPEHELKERVISIRNQVMSEFIIGIQRIMKVLGSEERVEYRGAIRLADFANFALNFGKAFNVEPKIQSILRYLGKSQTEFTLETDPVYHLLVKWSKNNLNRWIENVDLCKELTKIALKEGVEFPYAKKERAFAQKMKSIRSDLTHVFEIQSRAAGGNRTVYNYKLKTDI